MLESSAMTTAPDTQDTTASTASAAEPAPRPASRQPGGAEQPARRPRVFSGIQPSGTLHLGNYLGAIRNYVALQETHDCVYCVVDLHAITVRQAQAELKRNTIDVANMFLAAGVDPQRSIVIVQSHVPQHTELTWILNTVTYMGELRRMTQFKDKTGGGESESIGVGIFDYPVLMAADILLYRADAVPVGEDQKQHVELTRDLAERFNNAFGKTFVVPEPIIRDRGRPHHGPRRPGQEDEQERRVGLQLHRADRLARRDPPQDQARGHRLGRRGAGRPRQAGAVATCSTIYSLLAGESVETLVARYEGRGYADFKADLGEVVVESLAPFQRRMTELDADKGFTLDVLRDGAERAEAIAERTMAKVRERMGFVARA